MARKRNQDPYAILATGIAAWAPLTECSIAARWAWVAMWASAEMRRCCVGLFPGGVSLFADVCRIPFGDAVGVLDELVQRSLVEHDPVNRIIRFLTLPSRACRPANGSVLNGWWGGFKLLPVCAVRDRHVPLIEWLCEPFTDDHRNVWEDTFGTVQRVVENSDASYTVYQVPDPSSNQRNLFDSRGLVHRVGHGVSISTPISISTSPEREHEREGYPQAADGPEPYLAEGTDPGLRPLTLTSAAMLNAIAGASGGRFGADLVDSRLRPQLDSVAAECSLAGVTLADLDLAGRFLHAGGLAHRDDLGASWATRPGNVMSLVSSARRWQKGELRAEPRRRGEGDVEEQREPAPISAFKTGLRAL